MRLFPKRRAKSARITYASKDYVEHLRTVRFTLLTVSVGLIILMTTAKTYELRRALAQLHAILRLKEHWLPGSVGHDAGKPQSSVYILSDSISLFPRPGYKIPMLTLIDDLHKKVYRYKLKPSRFTL